MNELQDFNLSQGKCNGKASFQSTNSTQYEQLTKFKFLSFQIPCMFGISLSWRIFQCESDFRPLSMRRKSTSMPLCVLSLLIQPWVLLRLIFLGWYSVPLFLVRTCWNCHEGCWKTPEPSACGEISPHLQIRGPVADFGTIQLPNNLRWEVPARATFPKGMLLKENRVLFFNINIMHKLPYTHKTENTFLTDILVK